MKIRAMRGRDQKGLSFLSPSSEASLLGKTVVISYKGRSLLSDVRASKSVPEQKIVLDSRLFDGLELNGEVEVDVDQVTADLPTCKEIELVYWVLNSTAGEAVMQSEELRPYLGGRILKTGQEFTIAERGIRFRVERLHPVAALTQAARVEWKRPPRIEVHSADERRPSQVRERDTTYASVPTMELPESISEKKRSTMEDLLQKLADVSRELDKLESLDLQGRVESLEGRMSSLTGTEGHVASDTVFEDSQEPSSVSGTLPKNLYARLKEVVDRLESLSSRLEDLERRIDTLAQRKSR